LPELRAGRRYLDPGILPLQQDHPEVVLQFSDLMADRTLCDAQLRSGACERAMAGDSVERDEGCEGWQAAWHLDLLTP
jgi:hypothetical protein